MSQPKKKKALIAVNLIGFMWFIMDDIDMLSEMGYEVTVAGDNSANESYTVKEIERRGASFFDMKCSSKSPFSKTNIDAFRKCSKLIRHVGFDVVICHTPITGMVVRLSSFLFGKRGIKVAYMTHGLPWSKHSTHLEKFKFSTMERFGSLLCNAIITINPDDFEEAKKLCCNKVFMVNGVGCDIDSYSAPASARQHKRDEIGVKCDEIMVLCVGEISHRKTILQLFAHLESCVIKNDFIL